MKITMFDTGFVKTVGEVKDFTFEEFAALFKEPIYNQPKDGPYFVRGALKDGVRSNDNLQSLELLIIDGDSSVKEDGSIREGAPPASRVSEMLKVQNINHFIYSSYSHGKVVNGVKVHKWRCVIPFVLAEDSQWEDIDFKQTLKSNVSRIIAYLQQKQVHVAPVKENNVLSQPWYFPRREAVSFIDDVVDYEFYYNFKGDSLVADKKPLEEITVAGIEMSGQEDYERRIMDLWDSIYEGNTFHVEVRDLIYGKARDGLPRMTIIADMIAGLRSSQAKDPEHPNHHKWKREIDSLEKQVDEALAKFSPKSTFDIVELTDQENKYTAHKLPPGITGELAAEILETMTFPNQEIAIVAARHILCSISGRKCSIGSTKLDFVNVLVAEQATGKNTPNYCLSLILDQVKPFLKTQYMKEHVHRFKGSKGSYGIKGLYLDMSRSPSLSIIIPEAGERYKSKVGDTGGIKSFAMQMQSSPAHIAIDVPTYSEPLKELYGVVTSKIEESNLESYKGQFTSISIESGELARKLIHFAPHTPSHYTKYNKVRHQFSDELLTKLANIIEMAMDGEDYEYKPDEAKNDSGPCYKSLDGSKRIYFEFTQEAEALYDADHLREHEYRSQANPKDNNLDWALMGRRKQKIMREALLYAICDWAAEGGYTGRHDRWITENHYIAASEYVDECTRGILANAYLFRQDLSDFTEIVLQMVAKHMANGGSPQYRKAHKQAFEIKNGLVSHSFLMGGNTPLRIAVQNFLSNQLYAYLDLAKACDKIYAEGENLGYWEVLDVSTHPQKRKELGITNTKRYLKVTTNVIVKASKEAEEHKTIQRRIR